MKRNDEKYNKFLKKFERKKIKYLMVLGGSLSEDAKNFDESSYLETIKKKVPEYNEIDSKNNELVSAFIEGDFIYGEMRYSIKPLFCRILENIQDKSRSNLVNISSDLVYHFLTK